MRREEFFIEALGELVELRLCLNVRERNMLWRENLEASVIREPLRSYGKHLGQRRPFGIVVAASVLLQEPPWHRIQAAFPHQNSPGKGS